MSSDPSSSNRKLVFGDIVKIHSLTSATGKTLNKCIATIICQNSNAPAEEDRYVCHVRGRNSTFSLKRENLTLVFDTFQVGPSKIAGRGLIALRDIKPGEEIFRESALWSKPSVNFLPFPELLKHFNELSSSDRVMLTYLTGSGCPPLAEGEDPESRKEIEISRALNVASRNTFQFAGVVFTCSFANHSCNNSAVFYFDEASNEEVIYAIKPIAAGEEITVNYVGEYHTRKERQDRLLREKQFKCVCDICTHAQSDAIDRIITELAKIHETANPNNSIFLGVDQYEKLVQHHNDLILNELVAKYNWTNYKCQISVKAHEAFTVFVQLFPDVNKAKFWTEEAFKHHEGTICLTIPKWKKWLNSCQHAMKNPMTTVRW